MGLNERGIIFLSLPWATSRIYAQFLGHCHRRIATHCAKTVGKKRIKPLLDGLGRTNTVSIVDSAAWISAEVHRRTDRARKGTVWFRRIELQYELMRHESVNLGTTKNYPSPLLFARIPEPESYSVWTLKSEQWNQIPSALPLSTPL